MSRTDAGSWSFAYSPDGGKIAWLRTYSGNYQEIVIHDLATGSEHTITSDKKNIDELVWVQEDHIIYTTDKDGIILDLLAAEVRARTGRDPGERYEALAHELGRPLYRRVDAPASPAERAILKKLSPAAVRATSLAGEPITAKLTRAPGNGAEIGGLKVTTAEGWFAARPSGTEDVYKIYAESFRSEEHLQRILEEARSIVGAALEAG